MNDARLRFAPFMRTCQRLLACGLMGSLPAYAADTPKPAAVPAGTVFTLPLADLHPSQPSVGRDEVLGLLGRWRAEPERWAHDPQQQLRHIHRTIEHKFAKYCKDMGQRGLKSSFTSVAQAQAARLDDPTTFTCEGQPPTGPDDAGYAELATVVASPDGNWYLTDGHHTFTALWEVPDGGPTLPVRVRVLSTIEAADMDQFWKQMAQRGHAWLQAPDGSPLAPSALPRNLGLKRHVDPAAKTEASTSTGGLTDDPYRSLVYFTRNLGYRNDNLPDFAEFHWASWLRAQARQADHPWSLSDYQLNVLKGDTPPGYAQAVHDAAQRMRALPADAVVSGTLTAKALGQQPGGVEGDQTAKGALAALVRSDEDAHGRARTGGKLWYAVRERQRTEQPLQPPVQAK